MERGHEMNNLFFIEAAWFNTVGFVLVQDGFSRSYQCYTHKCGGDYNDKFTEDQDIEKIMMHGSTFPMEAAKEIFRFDTQEDWIFENPELFL